MPRRKHPGPTQVDEDLRIKWTPPQKDLLITFIETHPCFWDNSAEGGTDPDYKDGLVLDFTTNILQLGADAAGKDQKLSKSLSLPLAHVAPDPFPELFNSPLAPAVSYIRSSEGSSKSSPSSPASRQHFSPSLSPPRIPSAGSTTTTTPRRGSIYDLPEQQSPPPGDGESLVWTPHLRTSSSKTMLNFYTDEKSHKSVLLQDAMKASDVCYLLTLKNHALEDKSWAVVETISKFQLERCLEDHESVLQVFRSWGHAEDNRFYFRKDFRKYEVFKNPMQFFPSHMLDTKGIQLDAPDLISRPDRQQTVLLQNLFSTCEQLPDVQGFLHLRTGKKTWKKHFFVLRKSGLYYSNKGTSKDPRHLVLLSHISDMNIYQATDARKVLGAPNQFAFCLKPTYSVIDLRQMKCLCAEDEQGRNCWLMGLRLMKYGSQLRENYVAAVKREDKLQNIQNIEVNFAGQENLYIKQRVAMDFTGPGGRIVADPNEAIGVAYEEGQQWRKKVSPRTTSSPTPPYASNTTSSTNTPTGGGATTSDPQQPSVVPPVGGGRRPSHSLLAELHITQPWYHNDISREDAVRLLAEQGQVDGAFLVRESYSVPDTYVLSLFHNQKVKHCQIHKIYPDGELYFSLDGGHTKFSDLLQLVDFYQMNAGGLPTHLTHFVSRTT